MQVAQTQGIVEAEALGVGVGVSTSSSSSPFPPQQSPKQPPIASVKADTEATRHKKLNLLIHLKLKRFCSKVKLDGSFL